MDFKQYSPEELKECSMIEVVHSVLGDKRQATTFNELVQEIAQVLGLSQEQVNAKLAQFYTDLNIDGRFINLGENRCPSLCFTTYFISCIRFIINTIFIIARRKMG